jgi:hypothetical protein
MRAHGSPVDLQHFRCTLVSCGLLLPPDLTLDDWAAVGRTLGRQQHTLQWRIGDWWNHPGHAYGDRLTLVTDDAWTGPSYGSSANAGSVARRFETSRRHERLTFSHHVEVAHLPPTLADELLDWCEEPIAATGKPRSTRELREEANSRTHPRRSFGLIEAPKAVPLTVTMDEDPEEPALPRVLRVHGPIDSVAAGIRYALEATTRLSPALEPSAIEPVLAEAKRLVAALTESLRVARGESVDDPDGKVVKLRGQRGLGAG